MRACVCVCVDRPCFLTIERSHCPRSSRMQRAMRFLYEFFLAQRFLTMMTNVYHRVSRQCDTLPWLGVLLCFVSRTPDQHIPRIRARNSQCGGICGGACSVTEHVRYIYRAFLVSRQRKKLRELASSLAHAHTSRLPDSTLFP